MSASVASRTTTIVYSGAVAGTQEIAAADNETSPAMVELAALVTGDNAISVPTGATAVTIVPSSDNTTAITLKGSSGDTGIRLHNSDPSTLAIDASVSGLVLSVGANVVVRLFWT